MQVIKPPTGIAKARGFKIFLAGSIEMGKAEDWQTKLTKHIESLDKEEITIYNPRRDDWDSPWEQKISNDQFYEQVRWELQALDDADLIVMYLDPNTQSPISLLELGLHAESKKLVVCCPERFYRKGNVEIVCDRYMIPIVHNWPDLIDIVMQRITSRIKYEDMEDDSPKIDKVTED